MTDRKNVKPVREPFLKPKTTPYMIKRHIVHETLSLYMDVLILAVLILAFLFVGSLPHLQQNTTNEQFKFFLNIYLYWAFSYSYLITILRTGSGLELSRSMLHAVTCQASTVYSYNHPEVS